MAAPMFTWTTTHKELVEYLIKNRKQQKKLVDVLRKAGVTSLIDKLQRNGKLVDLEVIDPFTFFCYIYKYGQVKRVEILQNVAKVAGVTVPDDADGIPSVNAQQVCMFPFAYERKDNEVERLWRFFDKVMSNTVDDAAFADVLDVTYTGPAKITEGLYNIMPERYLPINGPVKQYLKEYYNLTASFETWTDYLQLLDKIKALEDIPFTELSYKSWRIREDKKEQAINESSDGLHYWIFQCNPKKFDLPAMLRREELETDWTVSAHRDNIRVGDKVIIWMTGPQAGCYALAEVTGNPKSLEGQPEAVKADLRITHNLVHSPIMKDQIEESRALRNLKVGNQGTNFSATESEYSALLAIAEESMKRRFWLYAPGERAEKWDDFYAASEMGIGWSGVGDLSVYQSQDDVEVALQKSSGKTDRLTNDARTCYQFASVIKPGDVVIARKGRKTLVGWGVVTSDYRFESGQEYEHRLDVDWKGKGAWTTEQTLPIITLTELTDKRGDLSYIRNLLGITDEALLAEPQMTASYNAPLNVILYGPPGTGKTHNTIKRAAEIVAGRTIDSYEQAREIFLQHRGTSIEMVTFHQSYSYEDFIQGIRPDTEDNDTLSFSKRDGVFKSIAERARKNELEATEKRQQKREFEEVFAEYLQPLLDGDQSDIEVKMKRTSYYITNVERKSIHFRKSGGGTQHSLSIATLKEYYRTEQKPEIQGLNVYYAPLLDVLLEKGKKGQHAKRPELQRFVLIIDEINRANISRVFGELITLIEPDKRTQGEHAMEVTLPSGESFSVPSNLYIIGTMNTADKSIALLDVALRRRFVFEPMYPLYSIPGQIVHDADLLQRINAQIIKLKGYDFQIGHAYFMGRTYNRLDALNNRVVPLLLEYFMNDEKKVRQILTEAGLQVHETQWPLRVLG